MKRLTCWAKKLSIICQEIVLLNVKRSFNWPFGIANLVAVSNLDHHSYNLINYKLFVEQRSCLTHLCTLLGVWHIVGNQEIFFNLIWSTNLCKMLEKCIVHNSLYMLNDLGKPSLSLHVLAHQENEELDRRTPGVSSVSKNLNADQ